MGNNFMQSLREKVRALDTVEKVLLTAIVVLLLVGVVSFAEQNFGGGSSQSSSGVRGGSSSGGLGSIGRIFGGGFGGRPGG